jgi:DNA-binding cell septation regulator SpoVG
MNLNVTKIRVKPIHGNPKVKGIARIIIADCFVVNSILICKGFQGIYLQWPNHKNPVHETQIEIAHPVNSVTAESLKKLILAEYEKQLQAESTTAILEPRWGR